LGTLEPLKLGKVWGTFKGNVWEGKEGQIIFWVQKGPKKKNWATLCGVTRSGQKLLPGQRQVLDKGCGRRDSLKTVWRAPTRGFPLYVAPHTRFFPSGV